MTQTTQVLPDGTTKLTVSFLDEGVNLTGETHVKGGQAEALAYLPTFVSDLKRNFAELFPVPPAPQQGGMRP